MVGWELPPFNSGGLGVACFHLAKELNKLTDLTFSLPTYLPINKVPFKLIFASSFFKKIISSYTHHFALINFINSETLNLVLTYGQRLLPVIENEPHIVHGHDWLTAPATIFLKEHFQVPSFIHVHSTEIERTGNNPNPIIFNIEKEYFEQSDYLLPVSDLTKDVLVKIYNIPAEKIIVLPNGFSWQETTVNLTSYLDDLKKEGWQIVLFVGRITLQKGPDYLMKAIPLVTKILPKTKFVFVGHGDMFPQLIKMSYELGISQNVIFASFLRDEKLASIYKSADLLVAPSVADPFGLVPLEGLNYNVPVIISKTTGVGYYLHHSLKFDFWDTYEMANKIIGLLKYQKLHQTYLHNIKQEAKTKFDWRKTAYCLYQTYQQCLQ